MSDEKRTIDGLETKLAGCENELEATQITLARANEEVKRRGMISQMLLEEVGFLRSALGQYVMNGNEDAKAQTFIERANLKADARRIL